LTTQKTPLFNVRRRRMSMNHASITNFKLASLWADSFHH
jgi:hypothetical protein